MKQMNKILGALTLSAALVLSSLGVTSADNAVTLAAETNETLEITDESLFHAEYVNGIYTITGFDGLYNASSIVVPYKINGQLVRGIDAAFCGKTNCLTVYLPDSIEIIGSKTFAASTVEYVKSYTNQEIQTTIDQIIAGTYETPSVESGIIDTPSIESGTTEFGASTLSDSLPTSLKVIGDNAFKDSKIKSITIVSNMETIGKYAFANTPNFLDFTLATGASIKNIDDYAFSCSQLHTITINGRVERLGNYAIEKTANITDFIVNDSGSIGTVGDYAFYNY